MTASQKMFFKGQYIGDLVVDDVDAHFLKQYRWYTARRLHAFYAFRHASLVDGRRTTVLLHRMILRPPNASGLVVDHANRNGLDNTRANLRVCTRAENMRNRRGANRGSASGFRGVTRHRQSGKWQAHSRMDGHSIHLGLFDTAEAAARAFDQWADEFYGEFRGARNLPAEKDLVE
jgi:hypothetical protein